MNECSALSKHAVYVKDYLLLSTLRWTRNDCKIGRPRYYVVSTLPAARHYTIIISVMTLIFAVK